MVLERPAQNGGDLDILRCMADEYARGRVTRWLGTRRGRIDFCRAVVRHFSSTSRTHFLGLIVQTSYRCRAERGRCLGKPRQVHYLATTGAESRGRFGTPSNDTLTGPPRSTIALRARKVGSSARRVSRSRRLRTDAWDRVSLQSLYVLLNTLSFYSGYRANAGDMPIRPKGLRCGKRLTAYGRIGRIEDCEALDIRHSSQHDRIRKVEYVLICVVECRPRRQPPTVRIA